MPTRYSISTEFVWYLLAQLERMVRDPALAEQMPSIQQRVEYLLQFFFFGVCRHD